MILSRGRVRGKDFFTCSTAVVWPHLQGAVPWERNALRHNKRERDKIILPFFSLLSLRDLLRSDEMTPFIRLISSDNKNIEIV